MSASTYSFNHQLEKAERIERELDGHFQSLGIHIHPASPKAQRAGIDRWFKIPLRTGGLVPVEYKSDWKASKSGNVFVELISVLRGNVIEAMGWAYSSQADWLFYCLPDSGYALHIEFTELRKHLAAWVTQFPQKPAQNQGYISTGILVPLEVFGEISIRQIKLSFG